jgi:hypothetical protein
LDCGGRIFVYGAAWRWYLQETSPRPNRWFRNMTAGVWERN